MVERTLRNILLSSLVIACLVFVAGILLGISLNDFKNQDAFDSLKLVDLNAESYLIEREFISTYNVSYTEEQACDTLRNRFYSLSDELNEIRHLLVSFEKDQNFENKEYDLLVREYFLTEIQVYLLLENFRSGCDDSINTLVFFYGLEGNSEQQGVIIDALFKERGDIFVITLKKDYNDGVDTLGAKDPLFDLFEDHFTIGQTPTLIVNGEKYEGLINYPTLNELVGEKI